MIKKLVCCQLCAGPVYESDGQFLWVADRRVNPDLDFQFVDCPNCGRILIWRRAKKFIGKDNSFKDRNFIIYERKKPVD
jgi:hypothetical protein